MAWVDPAQSPSNSCSDYSNIKPAHNVKSEKKKVPLLGHFPLLSYSPKQDSAAFPGDPSDVITALDSIDLKRPSSQGAGAPPRKAPPRRDRKLEKFLDRQITGPWEMKRAASIAQIEEHAKYLENYDSCFWGAHGADGFRKMLTSKFGSVTTAWRVALDPKDVGKVSNVTFMLQCREIGFAGNLKKAWKELDADEDGFITLKDLDLEAHKAIKTFMSLLLEKYGSTIKAWQLGLDVAGTHKLDEKMFVERCAAIGFDGDAKRLFRLLRVDPNRKCITLSELDPQAALALHQADPCAEHISEGGRSTPAGSPEPRCFSRHEKKPGWSNLTSTDTVPEDDCLLLPGDIRNGTSSVQSLATPPLSPSGSSPGNRARSRPDELSLSIEEGPGSMQSMRSMSEGSLYSSSSPSKKHLGIVTPTRTSNWIRELSKFQRHMGAQKKQIFDDKDMSMKTVEMLRWTLLQKYKDFLAAWRQALDIHDKGKITFNDLCDCLRSMGYKGCFKRLWAELDVDQTGFISLKELDPNLDAMIKEYKELVLQKHGNLVNGWMTFDKEGLGRVTEATFVEHCKNVDFTGDGRQLFRTFQTISTSKFLAIRDWDSRACRALGRNDKAMVTEETHVVDPHSLSFNQRQDNSFHQKWAKHNSHLDLEDLAVTHKEHHELDVGADDLGSLKAVLKRKYGTLATAWRKGLDPEGINQLPFNEFAAVLRREGFCGNVRAVWRECNPENHGYITMANFDPETDALLGSFRAQLVHKFGDLVTAWNNGFDPQGRGAGGGRLEEADFVNRCKRLGLDVNAKQLFAMLQERGRTFIMLKDIEPKAVDAFYRGDTKASTMLKKHGDKHVDAHLKAKEDGTLKLPPAESNRGVNNDGNLTNQRQAESPMNDSSFSSSPGNSRPRTADPEEEVPVRLHPSADTEGLQSPSSAHPGVVKPTHLSEWSTQLGLRQRREVLKINKEEADKRMGTNTVDGFRALLIDRYGTCVSAWRSLLDADGNGRLSWVEFCQSLRKLSFHGDVKDLWKVLRGHEKGYVTLDAIDPEADVVLTALREFLLTKYGCILDAWNKCLDENGVLWLDEAELTYKLTIAGYDAGGLAQWHKLFMWLLPDRTSRHIHVEDMQAVLIGVPNLQRRLLWMGERKPPPPVGHKDPENRPMETLRTVLVRKFGSLYTGWWRGIDVKRVGSVLMEDFERATLTIGFGGNLKHLKKALGDKEYVTLKDIDAELATAVETFQSAVIAVCGSFAEAWRTRLDVENNGYVEEPVFSKFCAEIQYPGSARALFRMFNPVQGRFYIFFEDFGPLSLPPDKRSPSRVREPEAWFRKDSSKKDANGKLLEGLQKATTKPKIATPDASPDKNAWQATDVGSESPTSSGSKPARALEPIAESSKRGVVSAPAEPQPAKQPADIDVAAETVVFSTDKATPQDTVLEDNSAANPDADTVAVAAEE